MTFKCSNNQVREKTDCKIYANSLSECHVIPPEVFVEHIFKYLSLKDIFLSFSLVSPNFGDLIRSKKDYILFSFLCRYYPHIFHMRTKHRINSNSMLRVLCGYFSEIFVLSDCFFPEEFLFARGSMNLFRAFSCSGDRIMLDSSCFRVLKHGLERNPYNSE